MISQIWKTIIPVFLIPLVFGINDYAFPSTIFLNNSEDESDSVAVDIELVNFLANDGVLSRLDVYVKILYDNVQFVKADNDTFQAKYDVDVVTESVEDGATESRKFTDTIKIESIDEASSTTKFNLNRVSFNLQPGEYEVTFKIRDKETQFETEFNREVTLKDFSGPEAKISDVLFLDGVQKDEESDNYIFTPRVSSIQSDDFRILAYFEIYNVSPEDSFKVKYQVLGLQDTVWYEHKYVSAGEGRITKNFIDVVGENLMHGSYRLKVFVEAGDRSFDVEKSFNWFLDGLPPAFRSVDEAIRVLKYLTSKDEYKRLLGLSIGEKHGEFLAFWKRHDPTPLTSENELRDEYYERVVYANEHYDTMSRKGWQTDRGWVYIMLGKPDNIHRNPYNMDFRTRRLGKTIKAIQVWDYYAYNRQLIFFDDNGFGQYRLENPETLYEILKN